jgi:hypothetical protein
MEHPTRSADPIPARALALVSGVVGVVAGLFLLGFFAWDSNGVWRAGFSLGHVNNLLGAIQFAALAPVAWALGRRMPATRTVRVATAVAVVAMLAFVVLSVLLVVGELTFATRIGPVMGTILAVYGWLLVVNLQAHRTRTLPRAVTRSGVLIAIALLTALVLVGAAYVLPGIVGELLRWLGWGLGGVAWLALPIYVLLLTTRVFPRFTASAAPAADEPVQGVRT